MMARQSLPLLLRQEAVGFAWTLGLAILLAAGGCTQGRLPASTASPSVMTRIAMLPVVDMARVYGQGRSVHAPLTGKVFVTGQSAPDLAILMTNDIEAHLRRLGYDVVPPSAVQTAADDRTAGAPGPLAERSLLMAAARQLEADAILIGYLYRVQDRQGGRFAVEQPASVTYGLYLIDPASGRITWSGEFDETQRALNEDLLRFGTFIKRRGEWITAEQMTTESLREILARFPEPADPPTPGADLPR